MAVPVSYAGVELLYEEGGRYDCAAPEEVPAMLQRYGVAVLPALLTPEECAAMNDGMWATCARLTSGLAVPLRRGDPRLTAPSSTSPPSTGASSSISAGVMLNMSGT
jgi:hypothetical protein